MATPPRPPARRPVPPGRTPAPGQATPARPGAPGGRPGPRRAEKIRYSAVRVEESRWARKLLVGVVVVAVIAGAIGWYRYLTRPLVVVRLPTAAPGAAPAPSPTAPPVEPAAASSERRSATEARGPVTLSARDLGEALRTDPELTPAQAFTRGYSGREVTWGGTVTSVSRVDRLLQFEFKDGDGIPVTAWCATDTQLSQGDIVTVRGHLAARQRDGFVVDRCQIL